MALYKFENGKYKELSHVAKDGDKAYFCDLTDKIANRVYLNGLVFLTKYAFNELFHGKNSIMVKHSADKALCIQTVNKITNTTAKFFFFLSNFIRVER